jgi:uncharacterized protein YerC
LWKGPSWYSCRPLVSKISEYASLYHFFCTVLGLEDAGLHHYLDDLASLRGGEGLSHRDNVAEVTKNLYKELLTETEVNTSTATQKDIW